MKFFYATDIKTILSPKRDQIVTSGSCNLAKLEFASVFRITDS